MIIQGGLRMLIRAVSLINLTHQGAGASSPLATFKSNFNGALSHHASKALDNISRGGQAQLAPIRTLLLKSLKNRAQFKPGQELPLESLNFGLANGRLTQLISCLGVLNKSEGLSLKPAEIDGKFKLICEADETNGDAPHFKLVIKPKLHPLGILSGNLVRASGMGYRIKPFVPSAEVELGEITSPVVLELLKGPVFSKAKTIKDLVSVYDSTYRVIDKKHEIGSKNRQRLHKWWTRAQIASISTMLTSVLLNLIYPSMILGYASVISLTTGFLLVIVGTLYTFANITSEYIQRTSLEKRARKIFQNLPNKEIRAWLNDGTTSLSIRGKKGLLGELLPARRIAEILLPARERPVQTQSRIETQDDEIEEATRQEAEAANEAVEAVKQQRLSVDSGENKAK